MTSQIRTTEPTRAPSLGRQIGRIGLAGASSLSRDILASSTRPGTVRNNGVMMAL
ncbi:hypothetical protein [Rhizobium paknamense]|uniref:Uncharacterized protein n=1 Tax=Rhizobium paknamense TaxID=1206817 RepID=A0ABU0IC07_9HYPH|nr:hypothetical protein [Rhizobium paknamense]MDQ0454821.1 hypothetical protein [Rhizobium paknamense]